MLLNWMLHWTVDNVEKSLRRRLSQTVKRFDSFLAIGRCHGFSHTELTVETCNTEKAENKTQFAMGVVDPNALLDNVCVVEPSLLRRLNDATFGWLCTFNFYAPSSCPCFHPYWYNKSSACRHLLLRHSLWLFSTTVCFQISLQIACFRILLHTTSHIATSHLLADICFFCGATSGLHLIGKLTAAAAESFPRCKRKIRERLRVREGGGWMRNQNKREKQRRRI